MSVVIAGVLPPFTLNLWQDVQAMLQYEFMRQALLAGTILSIVAGLVGYFVVLRHQAFAGESLSDVALQEPWAVQHWASIRSGAFWSPPSRWPWRWEDSASACGDVTWPLGPCLPGSWDSVCSS